MKNTNEEAEDKQRYWYQPKPAVIESTAYALLTYCLTNQVPEASRIAKWLSSKRNSLGGFSSTQVLIWLIISMHHQNVIS